MKRRKRQRRRSSRTETKIYPKIPGQSISHSSAGIENRYAPRAARGLDHGPGRDPESVPNFFHKMKHAIARLLLGLGGQELVTALVLAHDLGVRCSGWGFYDEAHVKNFGCRTGPDVATSVLRPQSPAASAGNKSGTLNGFGSSCGFASAATVCGAAVPGRISKFGANPTRMALS